MVSEKTGKAVKNKRMKTKMRDLDLFIKRLIAQKKK